MSDVQVRTSYTTTTPDLAGAWSFVMETVDKVGPAPNIVIAPIVWATDDPDLNGARFFEVVVSGSREATP